MRCLRLPRLPVSLRLDSARQRKRAAAAAKTPGGGRISQGNRDGKGRSSCTSTGMACGRPCRVIGEVFDTYILVELDGENLWIVDKHAAHERLLYEKIKGQKEGEAAQLLLEPIPVTLDKTEYAAVLESLDIFSQAGLELEDFGGGTVLVRSAPLSLEGADISGAVMEMAGIWRSPKRTLPPSISIGCITTWPAVRRSKPATG